MYGSVDYVPIVSEYLDIFPNELPRLPLKREIEFCIDLISDMKPIFVPLYRITLTELRKLKE